MAVSFGTLWLPWYDTRQTLAYGGDAFGHSGGDNAVFDYFTDTPSVDDTFTLNGSEPFAGVRFYVATPMDGTPTIIWEYCYGATWKELRVENGDAIMKAGMQEVRWTPPYDWTPWSSAARPGLRVRMRLTDVSGVTEGGANGDTKAERPLYAFVVTGTGQTMANVLACDLATPYTLLSATTPDASLTPIESTYRKTEKASKVQVILANCTLGAGDAVILSGIDTDGDSIIEVIDVSGGDGTYTSRRMYMDVLDVACTGFTDGTITVQTPRLGLIYAPATTIISRYYDLFASVHIGDGTTTTSFSAAAESWRFIYGATWFCAYGNMTTVTLGAMDTVGNVVHSTSPVFIHFYDPMMRQGTNKAIYQPRRCLVAGGATMRLYGTKMLWGGGGNSWLVFAKTTWDTIYVREVDMQGGNGVDWSGSWPDADGFWTNALRSPTSPTFTGATPQRITLSVPISMYNHRGSFTLAGSQIESFSYVNNLDSGRKLAFIDCPGLEGGRFSLNTALNTYVGNGIYIQFTLALIVTDASHTPLDGVTVQVTDVNGALVSDQLTLADGSIVSVELIKEKGSWGVNPSTLTFADYTPHTVTLSKAGYKTRVLQYTMDQARDEVEMLEAYVPVVAGFDVGPAEAEHEVQFADASTIDLADGDTATYAWDFGDGVGVSSERNPRYEYAAAGTYDVTLTVTTSWGGSDSNTQSVVVDPLVPPRFVTEVNSTVTAEEPVAAVVVNTVYATVEVK